MNREIKFRVWDEKFNCWDNCSDGGHYLLLPKINIIAQGRIFQQFTGLKDINDVEIYEGDILRKWFQPKNGDNPNFQGLPPFEVKYNQQHCGFTITKGRSHYYQILGNIFENPELLENAR